MGKSVCLYVSLSEKLKDNLICIIGWVDIGSRLEIQLGFTGTPITLKKMTLTLRNVFRAVILVARKKNPTLVMSQK